MFSDLPETQPIQYGKRKRAVAVSALIHGGLVTGILLVQMFAPMSIGPWELLRTTYMAPPPPAAPLGAETHQAEPEKIKPRAEAAESAERQLVPERSQPVQSAALIQPREIPGDVAKILDAAPGAGSSGVIGGIPGGVPGGVPGLSLLSSGVNTAAVPPPPKEPVRVGGDVREPRVAKMVQPVYPPNAIRQHIEGEVVLEATVTETGQVQKVKVISGPPALTAAAIEAVEQWRYEPTTLNGQAVPVILTARVNFSLKGRRQ